jgi:hypothetical protein
MTVVPYSVDGGTFNPGRIETWSDTRFASLTPMRTYGAGVDIHPDGQRFVVAPPFAADPDRGSQDHMIVVLNFSEELKRLAPPK